jgi:retron-type reverse transcriptase
MRSVISPRTLDRFSVEIIQDLVEKLNTEQYQFSPGRRLNIPKKSGGMRALTISSPIDKVVQEAMRILLNAVFEPTFGDESHGFRPNRSQHTCLKMISQKFQPCT